MKDINILKKRLIPSKCCPNYINFTYDGCYFYFTLFDKCEILKFDKHFCNCEKIKTCTPYHCICYDHKENCFWATSRTCPTIIFKLNKCFQEIDCICLKLCLSSKGYIQGISYNCITNNLILAYANCILEINKNGCIVKKIIKSNKHVSLYTSIVSIAPYIVTSYLHDNHQYVAIYDCEGKLIDRLNICDNFIINDIVFNPCTDINEHKLIFYVFGYKCCKYPYIFKVEYCNPCCQLCICDCNYYECKCDCSDCDCDCSESCCDIMESIALVEASVSHILNAEGEKLQKVLTTTDNVCEILKTNNAINQTIVNATHLEQVLYNKLETLKDICPKHCNKDCKDDEQKNE